ncbi:hypothetical protein Syun_006796 [Stephania yunnanensis]|uniref:Uncharacterized protein n=1 Tax=Stephania yunnanensis TaxID=152371 RepID=A0AAP0KZW3_9MAGN
MSGPPIDSGCGPTRIAAAAKAGLLLCRGDVVLCDRGEKRAPFGVPPVLRALGVGFVGSPFGRLETRTKESTCVRVNGRVNRKAQGRRLAGSLSGLHRRPDLDLLRRVRVNGSAEVGSSELEEHRTLVVSGAPRRPLKIRRTDIVRAGRTHNRIGSPR